MVTVFLRGGLGNQMFQAALGLNLAKKNNTDLVFDTVFLSDRFPRRNFSYRTFDLDVFSFGPHLTGFSRLADSFPIPGVWLGLDFLSIGARSTLGFQKPVKEQTDAFDPDVLEIQGNLLLYGRWQSEKYFTDIADDVRAAFKFRHALEGEAKELARKIASSNSVSLHVRRGDFVAFKNVEALMGKTDMSYYASAADHVGKRVKDPEFFVFSDDIEWCKANIKVPFPVTYVSDDSEGPKSAFHLELMSLCKHNIIANSTFSWWGAWLNANPSKIVTAPAYWSRDAKKNPDLLPASWVRL